MKIHTLFSILTAFQIGILVQVPSPAAAEQFDGAIGQPVLESSLDQLSTEEKEWFQKFQEGTFYAQGWKEITADILSHTPDELRDTQRLALKELGVKIGCEWSKDNDIRKIDNDMLMEWGRLLKSTAGRDPYQLPEVIAEIDEKVAMLLN